MYKLNIISSSVRPGRKGPIIAKWMTEVAKKSELFQVEFIDLGELNLPIMNERNHPVLKKYELEHTKKWSATIDEADAFIFVTAEYNYGYPAALKNALEYLSQEWGYKAAGIVSYGGFYAGTRAANSLKGDLATFKTVPMAEAVNIPFYSQFINEQSEFVPTENTQLAAQKMLKEMLRWTKGLKLFKEDK